MSGPTYFAPILQEFGNHVRAFEGQFVYNILVILTDGQICDMAQTTAAIVDLSFLPCSIIIVGVGNNEDWSCMESLDRTGGPLTDNRGRQCKRDIVEFVPFARDMLQGNLSEDVLRKVPLEFCTYME